MARILVTGGSGLLGYRLVPELLERGHEVIALYYSHKIPFEHKNLIKRRLDLSNRLSVEDYVLKVRPEVIVHAAAYTDVDGCEVNREYAWRVNVEATRSIIRVAKIVKSYVIYISTDYVFDGSRGLYRETDIPYPISFYGLTKLIGEEYVRSSNSLYTIVRPSAIYGVGPGKLNFALFVANGLSKGEKVRAIVDQYVSPTLNTLLARAIGEIVNLRPMGTLHVAGERMSRYDFAIKIARTLGLPDENVLEAKLEDFNWKARRPRDSSLDTSRARNILKTQFYDMDLALKLFKKEYERFEHASRNNY